RSETQPSPTRMRSECLANCLLRLWDDGCSDPAEVLLAADFFPDLAIARLRDEEPADDCRHDRDDDRVRQAHVDVAIGVVRGVEPAQIEAQEWDVARADHRGCDQTGEDRRQPAAELTMADVI